MSLLFQFLLIYLFLSLIVQGYQHYISSVYPAHFCIINLKPLAGILKEQFPDSFLRHNRLFKQLVDISVFQFFTENATHIPVGEQAIPRFKIPDINSAAHIIKNSFQTGIGACQRILLDPSCEDTLQDLHGIRQELDLFLLPDPVLPLLRENAIHIDLSKDHDGNYHKCMDPKCFQLFSFFLLKS